MHCPTLRDLPPPPAGKTGWPWTEGSPQILKARPDRQLWPRISIVTPSYNQGSFLEETIRSVLLQGYPDLEYFIMDGNSKDESIEIIRKYEPWLIYWESKPDRGQSHAINKGWARASGDLIAYLNSDDFYFPSALQTVAEARTNNGNVSMITGGVAFTDPFSEVRNERMPLLKCESPVDLSLLEPMDWNLPQQSTFFVTEYLDQVGRMLREDLHYTMDRELMYRMCRSGIVVLLQETLAGDRQHPDSKRLSQTIPMYEEDAAALDYCTWGGEREKNRRKLIARWRLAQGHYHFADRAPNILSAIFHLFLAVYYRPSYLRQYGFKKAILRTFGLLGLVQGSRNAWSSYIRR
jgi:glycosyltransferase involved in cell wall biosynthesis